jgi:hypothetical protein
MHRAGVALGAGIVIALMLFALGDFTTYHVPTWIPIGVVLVGGGYFLFVIFYLLRCPRCSNGLWHLASEQSESLDDVRACAKCGLRLNTPYYEP